jgi:suppressor for copper-sensitivity B
MVQPRQSGQPLKLRLKLDYGICREICIPYRTDLALDLTAGAAAPTVFADLIARYDARVPIAAAQAGVTIEQTREIVAGGKRVLEVAVRARSPLRAPDLIVEGPPPFWFGTPQVSLSEGGGKALFLVPIETGRLSAALAGTSLGLTLLDGERAVETQIIFGR